MKRVLVGVLVTAGVALFASGNEQTTQPTPSERLAQTAKDFGVTPEELQTMMRRQMGEPVVIDDGLIVGVHRDDAGRVKTVKINTPKRFLTFNLQVEEGQRGMEYYGGQVAADVPFASAVDIDGVVRIDQIIIRHPSGTEPPATLLLRIGDRFESAIGTGESLRYKLITDGRVVRFDRTTHEWVDAE